MPPPAVRRRSHLAQVDDAPVLLLLAAGRSRRLGRPKAALSRQGLPLLVHQLRLARAARLSRACVVLGADAPRLEALLGPGTLRTLAFKEVRVMRARRWRGGMGESLREGLRGLPPDWRRVLILLVDQVGVQAPDLRRLSRRRETGVVVVAASHPTDNRRAQAPVVLTRAVVGEACAALHGDRGLAVWLRELPLARIRQVAIRGLDQDLDTPADARAWRSAQGRPQ